MYFDYSLMRLFLHGTLVRFGEYSYTSSFLIARPVRPETQKALRLESWNCSAFPVPERFSNPLPYILKLLQTRSQTIAATSSERERASSGDPELAAEEDRAGAV